jgi:hypothetical protein
MVHENVSGNSSVMVVTLNMKLNFPSAQSSIMPQKDNNNNIYLLQMGCHPMAVITLHVFPNTANKFT